MKKSHLLIIESYKNNVITFAEAKAIDYILVRCIKEQTETYPFVHINTRSIRKQAGSNDIRADVILDILTKLGIRVNKSYKVGSFPKSFQHPFNLTKIKFELAELKPKRKAKAKIKEFIQLDNSPASDLTKISIEKLHVDIDSLKAFQWENTLKELIALDALDRFDSKGGKISRSNQSNRLYSPVAMMPKDARRHLKSGSKGLYEIDIKSAIVLYAIIRMKDYATPFRKEKREEILTEADKLQKVYETDYFYSWIGDKCNTPKDKVKQQFQKYVGRKHVENRDKLRIAKVLNKEFPYFCEMITQSFADYKPPSKRNLNDNDDYIFSSFALNYQQWESSHMIDKVMPLINKLFDTKLTNKEKFALSVHDAILLLDDLEVYSTIDKYIRAYFKKEIGINVKTDGKKLGV